MWTACRGRHGPTAAAALPEGAQPGHAQHGRVANLRPVDLLAHEQPGWGRQLAAAHAQLGG
eukprot:CAMPEP_0168465592 /NCGR_PEP_ID=MMETSP0228-20121227/56197_1 /TAXON_ID=133427 /ORGANISM="Protoceratium reticulatum, Strain CCCM 535 (=CCMP 1889)" /LENGTH=60 /DNA_ID=CAMNT_0008481177 /DNA_START=8 /DNA_END=186 /DNA_ORIENTATION=-